MKSNMLISYDHKSQQQEIIQEMHRSYQNPLESKYFKLMYGQRAAWVCYKFDFLICIALMKQLRTFWNIALSRHEYSKDKILEAWK